MYPQKNPAGLLLRENMMNEMKRKIVAFVCGKDYLIFS